MQDDNQLIMDFFLYFTSNFKKLLFLIINCRFLNYFYPKKTHPVQWRWHRPCTFWNDILWMKIVYKIKIPIHFGHYFYKLPYEVTYLRPSSPICGSTISRPLCWMRNKLRCFMMKSLHWYEYECDANRSIMATKFSYCFSVISSMIRSWSLSFVNQTESSNFLSLKKINYFFTVFDTNILFSLCTYNCNSLFGCLFSRISLSSISFNCFKWSTAS